ncbi:MAG: sulfatase-like hydrolase/transferase [Pirellulaceae bacterium]
MIWGLVLAGLLCGNALAEEPRPNFLWVMSEDNSQHYLRSFDPHGAETPQIERLATEGLRFRHAFSNSPVCSVARTTLITSCFAPRIGTQYHRKAHVVPLPDGLKMFPAYLREAGYYTTNNVKTDYNAVASAGTWDDSSRRATWRNRKLGQPFFHQQTFTTTHESSLHFTAEQMKNNPTETDQASVFVPPYLPQTDLARYTVAFYHDRIRRMDRQVGQLVSQLEEDGLLETTFIFYFGDHGGVLPGSKGYAREAGLHVPLVVRVPEKFRDKIDAPAGMVVDGFVSFIDFGPTLLHLAGIDVQDEVDGKPFLGEGITLAEVNQRDEAFGYADRFDEKYDLVRTLRKGRYHYIRSFQPFNFDGLQNNYRYNMLLYRQWREMFEAGELNALQSEFFQPRAGEALYDIEADPHETKNLAGDPEYQETLLALRENLTAKLKELPDLSFFPESFLIEGPFENPTAFGQEQQKRIGKLIETANLAVLPWEEAEEKITAALEDNDPWVRYWGVIAASAIGSQAKPLTERINALAEEDSERLVRVRAAEFLGLTQSGDPAAILRKALREAETATEANLILNTVVLLRDGKPGYEIPFSAEDVAGVQGGREELNRRIKYLTGE